MATRFGHTIHEWLIRMGWGKDNTPHPPGWFGDPQVVDPQTGDKVGLYAAVDLQKERTGQSPDLPV